MKEDHRSYRRNFCSREKKAIPSFEEPGPILALTAHFNIVTILWPMPLTLVPRPRSSILRKI